MAETEREWRINEREYTRITDEELVAILDDTGADSPANDSYTPDRVYAMARGLRDARRLIEAITAPGSPAPAEVKAKLYRELSKLGADGKAEGTRESLERSMKMIDTWAADALPAEPNGQVHFARAMLESVADEIRAYLATLPPADDATPLTFDWLAGQCEMQKMPIGETGYECDVWWEAGNVSFTCEDYQSDPGEPVEVRATDWQVDGEPLPAALVPKTRGEFRRLCEMANGK